jgi:hypothetical protein
MLELFAKAKLVTSKSRRGDVLLGWTVTEIRLETP